jgi:hypothetical protein
MVVESMFPSSLLHLLGGQINYTTSGEPKAALTEALKELEILKNVMVKNVKEMVEAEE